MLPLLALEELPYPWHLYTGMWPAGKVRNPITKAWVEIPADIPEWSADETYALNAIVRHQGKEYLHSSDRQGEPDACHSAGKMAVATGWSYPTDLLPTLEAPADKNA